jgi:hypothetical protein
MFRVISEGFWRHRKCSEDIRNVLDFTGNIPVKELCLGID